jgi:fucose 4-O-acetylase-like acetyltransferase
MLTWVKQLYYPKTSTQESMEGKRDYYIDNLKYLLIVLVVVGHIGFKLPYVKEVKSFIYFIYLFHMPCFVFTSGYLAKSMTKGGKLRVDKIFAVFWMYLIFKFGNVLLGMAFGQKVGLDLLKDGSAPWYLVTLSIWYMAVPVLERIKAQYLIPASLLIGCFIGYYIEVKDMFSLSRVFVFFPFFIIGYKLSKEKLEQFLNQRIRILALIMLVIAFFMFATYRTDLGSVYEIMYGGTPYEDLLGSLAPYGFFIRGAWYLIAIVLSAIFMLLVPRGKLFFTKFGDRTMQIYITHIWLRYILARVGFFAILRKESASVLFLVLFASVIVTLLLSNKLLKVIFDKLVPTSLFQRVLKKD